VGAGLWGNQVGLAESSADANQVFYIHYLCCTSIYAYLCSTLVRCAPGRSMLPFGIKGERIWIIAKTKNPKALKLDVWRGEFSIENFCLL